MTLTGSELFYDDVRAVDSWFSSDKYIQNAEEPSNR